MGGVRCPTVTNRDTVGSHPGGIRHLLVLASGLGILALGADAAWAQRLGAGGTMVDGV